MLIHTVFGVCIQISGTLAILETFDNRIDAAFFKGIEHGASLPSGQEDSFQAHDLQVVGSQGLLASEHFTNLRNGAFRILFQQMDNSQPHWMGNSFEDERNFFQLGSALWV